MAPNHGEDPLGSILGPMGPHWVQKMGQYSKKLPGPKVRIFDCPAVIGFSQKMEVTVMVPNHGGDTIESILGPIGSHWVKKMGQNRKKLPCPKIRIFDYPAVIDFFQKNLSHGNSANSRWGPPRVHFGANGLPLGPNNASKLWKITMPKNSKFRLPHGHRFFPKNGSHGYGAKSRWRPPRVHLGANGVPMGPKHVSKQ